MQVFRPDNDVDKGWFAGPWDSDLDISLGYANTGVDIPHHHKTMREIYFFARGDVTMLIDGVEHHFPEQSCVIIEPGEVHTFVDSSPDHYHFVIQTPGLQGDAAIADKVLA
ncbi:MAG: AraC family ligand binding domain-containing protein [Pseudomonadota bacterium]